MNAKRKNRKKWELIRRSGSRWGKCHYCGAQCAFSELTLDHIVPVADGGSNSLDNLVLACRPCNVRKGKKSKDEFLKGAKR